LGIGGRLVVLQSPEEREQLWHELSSLTAAPTAVWIGLSQVGNPAPFQPPSQPWNWEDDASDNRYRSEWGDQEPSSSPLPAPSPRAYLWHQGVADDTLAHSEQPPTHTLPYVCEITADTL